MLFPKFLLKRACFKMPPVIQQNAVNTTLLHACISMKTKPGLILHLLKLKDNTNIYTKKNKCKYISVVVLVVVVVVAAAVFRHSVVVVVLLLLLLLNYNYTKYQQRLYYSNYYNYRLELEKFCSCSHCCSTCYICICCCCSCCTTTKTAAANCCCCSSSNNNNNSSCTTTKLLLHTAAAAAAAITTTRAADPDSFLSKFFA